MNGEKGELNFDPEICVTDIKECVLNIDIEVFVFVLGKCALNAESELFVVSFTIPRTVVSRTTSIGKCPAGGGCRREAREEKEERCVQRWSWCPGLRPVRHSE